MKQIKEPKLITITREDISDGYKVVQSCHSIADFAFEFPETFSQWKKESNSIICLSVKNEFELQKIYHKYKQLTDTVKKVDKLSSLFISKKNKKRFGEMKK